MASHSAGLDTAVVLDADRLDVYRVAREFDAFAVRLLPRRGHAGLRDQLERASPADTRSIFVDRSEQKVVNDVASHGFHMITVPDDQAGPGFTYTIGLFKTWNHPEVVVFGIGQSGPGIVSFMASLVRDGQVFADGAVTAEILEDLDCAFKAVRPEH